MLLTCYSLLFCFSLFFFFFFKQKTAYEMRISDWSSDVCSSDLWKTLYVAQRDGVLATTGTYGSIRHPQYLGFILVMFGFLLQWPTLLTLLMFPVLVVMYVRLARTEERDAIASFGTDYESYRRRVPGFIPRLARAPS